MATQLDDQIGDVSDEAEDTEVDAEQAQADDQGGDDDTDEHDVITFGDTGVAGEDEPEGVRNLRKRLREVETENRALKGQPKVENVGPRPSLEDFEYDEDKHAEAVVAWADRKRRVDEQGEQQEQLSKAVTQDVEAGQRAYQEQRASLRLPGFEAADDKVVDALPELFVNAINLAAGDKAAALRFFLGNNPEQLAKLTALDPRKITDLIKAAAMAGAMAKEINVQRKKPMTQPETVHRGGTAPKGGDAKLERLEREAEKTHDRTALIAYKRELRERRG